MPIVLIIYLLLGAYIGSRINLLVTWERLCETNFIVIDILLYIYNVIYIYMFIPVFGQQVCVSVLAKGVILVAF